jgi:hypothetical protein
MQNNCDGSGPHQSGVVKILPTGGDGNAILCRACYEREMAWRRMRNEELREAGRFEIPWWGELVEYKAV